MGERTYTEAEVKALLDEAMAVAVKTLREAQEMYEQSIVRLLLSDEMEEAK